MNSKHREDEWQDLAPSLAKMEKKNPYLVPDGYFESLQSRIEQKVNSARPERSDGYYFIPEFESTNTYDQLG